MYGEKTWATYEREKKVAQRKEIVGSILFFIFIGISFWISLFI